MFKINLSSLRDRRRCYVTLLGALLYALLFSLCRPLDLGRSPTPGECASVFLVAFPAAFILLQGLFILLSRERKTLVAWHLRRLPVFFFLFLC